MTTDGGVQVPPPLVLGGGVPPPLVLGGGVPPPLVLGGGVPPPLVLGGGVPPPLVLGGGVPPPLVEGGPQVLSASAVTGAQGKALTLAAAARLRRAWEPAGVSDRARAVVTSRLRPRLPAAMPLAKRLAINPSPPAAPASWPQ